jgi:mannose-6-phosphate isomerase-like protein (cupin superfamily)
MHTVTGIIAVIVMALSLLIVSANAETPGDKTPRFTKGKFAVPVNPDKVTAAWAAQGYHSVYHTSHPQGWARDAHTHAWDIFLTILSGRMEFLIDGQRFVVEPGDELFYPAHAVISARNVYDGLSLMLHTRH